MRERGSTRLSPLDLRLDLQTPSLEIRCSALPSEDYKVRTTVSGSGPARARESRLRLAAVQGMKMECMQCRKPSDGVKQEGRKALARAREVS